MKTALAITALILVAGCACDDTAEIDMAIENAKLRAERHELRAYRDSVEASREKWALVDEIVAGMDKAAPDFDKSLSCVVSLANTGQFKRVSAAPSQTCGGEPFSGPVDYRWQIEFTTATNPKFSYFLNSAADSIRMRVHPVDSQGRTGCEPGVPAWSEWLEVSDGNSK